MTGELNLAILLKKMKPLLQNEPYVFLTSTIECGDEAQKQAVMIFREAEGLTMIVRESWVITNNLGYKDSWAMITLTIYSDLHAVGFLAVITKHLAAAGISVNAVSAFYHDHIFVPWEKRAMAMSILESLSENK